MSFLRNLSSCPKDVKATCYVIGEISARIRSPCMGPLHQEQHQQARSRTTTCSKILSQQLPTYKQRISHDSRQIEARCQQLKAAMLYRIINHRVDIQATSLFIPAGSHTRGHANKFLAPFGSVNTFKYSFYPSSIRLWNSTPAKPNTLASP